MKQKDPEKNYKTCIWCRKEWNVSVQNTAEYYVCPVCRCKGRSEQHGRNGTEDQGDKR